MGGACFCSLSPLIFIFFSGGQIRASWGWFDPALAEALGGTLGCQNLPVPDAVPACAGQQGHTAQIISPSCEIGPKGSFLTSENIL